MVALLEWHYSIYYIIIKASAKLTLMGFSRGSPGTATCVGIYRGSMGEYIGGFSIYLGVQSPLYVEFMGVILTLEETSKRKYQNLWLESDHVLVCNAFKDCRLVPWSLRNRWRKFFVLSANKI